MSDKIQQLLNTLKVCLHCPFSMSVTHCTQRPKKNRKPIEEYYVDDEGTDGGETIIMY